MDLLGKERVGFWWGRGPVNYSSKPTGIPDFLTGERTFQSVPRRVERAELDANGLENPFSFTLRERMTFASATPLRGFA